ncbi:MAG: hypothetical protein KIC73_00445 [Clostridiales bacterium]|nr:hypothetical protein [Clostridiales bacterium]
MSSVKCENYEMCEQYGTHGQHCESDFELRIYSKCSIYEMQTIKILASIDQKLSKLLEK